MADHGKRARFSPFTEHCEKLVEMPAPVGDRMSPAAQNQSTLGNAKVWMPFEGLGGACSVYFHGRQQSLCTLE
jgi:hypothetical protein